jgi:hypothetical protein
MKVIFTIYAGLALWMLWQGTSTTVAEQVIIVTLMLLLGSALVMALLNQSAFRWVAVAALTPLLVLFVVFLWRRLGVLITQDVAACSTCSASQRVNLIQSIVLIGLIAWGGALLRWVLRKPRGGTVAGEN